ncbi:cytochrome P450 [Scleroderma yunnanense]
MLVPFTLEQIVCTVCAAAAFAALYIRLCVPKGLPPGITQPWFLLEIPNQRVWLKALELKRRYGDILFVHIFGYTGVIIGSAKIAEDLLEKRSVIYADRPRSVMAGELSGWGKVMLLSDYNDRFRQQRKWIAQEIGGYGTVQKWHGLIEYETRRFLRSMLNDPERTQAHVRRTFTSIILRITYGYKTMDGDDPLVDLPLQANSQLALSTSPGAYYVDVFPFLRYIPSWLPGAGFKRKSKQNAAVLRNLVEVPYQMVKAQLTAGAALPSFTTRLLNKPNLTEEYEDSVKWASTTLYHSGADTSGSVAYALYLAMTLFPRVQKKAQAELDAVVGTKRLPTFADRQSLPYVEALFTELLRWQTPGPLTMRCTRSDDVYEGSFIPAGSYVFVNIWGMLRDERTYTDPLEFKPERFLGDKPETDPRNVCFGLGRRRCPGYFLGYASVWLMCAQALAVFDISKCIENGVEITPKVELEGATIAHQAPFKCSIKPRSAEARALIEEAFPYDDKHEEVNAQLL